MRQQNSVLISKYEVYVKLYNSPASYQITPEISAFLNRMCLFTIGHDRGFRPIIYMNLSHIKNSEIAAFTHCVSYYSLAIKKRLLKPYFVENWVSLLDLEGRSLFNIPFKALRALTDTTSITFAGCMHRMFFLNPSIMFYGVWQVISGFLHSATREKITVVGKGKEKELLKYIDKDQLLEAYGGTLKRPARALPFQLTFKEGELPEVASTEDTYIPVEKKKEAPVALQRHLSPPAKIVHEQKPVKNENMISINEINKVADERLQMFRIPVRKFTHLSKSFVDQSTASSGPSFKDLTAQK